MSDGITLPVEWQESLELPYEGQYFVAVRFPNGLGTYDIAAWNGRAWELGYTAEVVGWVTMNSFWDVVQAGWPKGDSFASETFAKNYRPIKPDGSDDFVLVD